MSSTKEKPFDILKAINGDPVEDKMSNPVQVLCIDLETTSNYKVVCRSAGNFTYNVSFDGESQDGDVCKQLFMSPTTRDMHIDMLVKFYIYLNPGLQDFDAEDFKEFAGVFIDQYNF